MSFGQLDIERTGSNVHILTEICLPAEALLVRFDSRNRSSSQNASWATRRELQWPYQAYHLSLDCSIDGDIDASPSYECVTAAIAVQIQKKHDGITE